MIIIKWKKRHIHKHIHARRHIIYPFFNFTLQFGIFPPKFYDCKSFFGELNIYYNKLLFVRDFH